MNSFGIFHIIQQYTTFEYKKKIYEHNLIFKHVVLYQLKATTTTNIQSLITIINA